MRLSIKESVVWVLTRLSLAYDPWKKVRLGFKRAWPNKSSSITQNRFKGKKCRNYFVQCVFAYWRNHVAHWTIENVKNNIEKWKEEKNEEKLWSRRKTKMKNEPYKYLYYISLSSHIECERRKTTEKKNPDHDNMIWHNAAPRSKKIGEFRKCKFQK